MLLSFPSDSGSMSHKASYSFKVLGFVHYEFFGAFYIGFDFLKLLHLHFLKYFLISFVCFFE